MTLRKCHGFSRRRLRPLKPKLEAAGYKPNQNGAYDLRDLDRIRAWAKELAIQ